MADGQSRRLRVGIRLGLLLTVLVGVVVAAKLTGVTEHLSVAAVRQTMESMGPWGFVVFLGVFALGELIHIPGVVFVAAAVFAYGRLVGGAAAYVGAVLSVCISFWVVRGVGGKLLDEIQRPFLRKWLDRLERQPIRVVAVLRLFLWMAPALNFALAMSNIRFRDYLLGSIAGLLVPIALSSLFIDWVVATFL